MSNEYQDWKRNEIFELKQEIIRTRKALEQSEICCTEWEKQALDYKAENIALSGELERTRKALDVAKDALKLFCGEDVSYYSQSKIDARDVRTALEQITALEQKKMTPEEFAELELLANTTFK